MAGVRRLFINDTGLDSYARLVAEHREDNDNGFADIIEARLYILNQAKLASKFHKIRSISLTEKGEWRIRTNDLFITTSDTGRVRRWFVGDWKITVKYSGEIRWYPSTRSQETLGYSSHIWSGNRTVHPHISTPTHTACLGNAQTPLQLYIKNGEIKALCLYLIGFLESVNIQDSAGCELGYCKEVKLLEDGSPDVDDAGNYIFVENEFTDLAAKSVSRISSEQVDTKYKEYITTSCKRCDMCGTYHNTTHMKELMSEDERGERMWVCEDCSKDLQQCDVCGKMGKIVATDTKRDIKYCSHCANMFVKHCDFCGEEIFVPADKTLDVPLLLQLNYNMNLTDTDETGKKYKRVVLGREADERKGITINTICEDCFNASKHIKTIKDRIIFGDKVETTEDVCKLVKDIPILTYKYKCSHCGEKYYLENLIAVPNSRAIMQ